METIFSNPTPTIRLSVPPVRTISSTCNLKARTSLSSKKLLFWSQNRRRVGFSGISVRRFVISCGVSEINESQFSDTVLKSHLPVLVEFVANWCGPCRLMSSAIDWVSQEYNGRLKVVKIDHDANPQLIDEYKVYGLPALILFKNGQEVPESRREGAMTKVKLKEYLDALLDLRSVT